MNAIREAVLLGSLEAAQLHADAGLDSTSGAVSIDVYEFIASRDIELVFHKLGGLLGAYLEIQRPGILVTTERPLAIQRFTAAHELGHAVLKHKIGVDGRHAQALAFQRPALRSSRDCSRCLCGNVPYAGFFGEFAGRAAEVGSQVDP